MEEHFLNLAPRYKRILAYFIDIIPLTLLVFAVFYYFSGFKEVLEARVNNTSDDFVRKDFLYFRGQIRNYTLLIWVVYSTLMDSSVWQGTVGKKMMGIQVTNSHYERLSLNESIKRNCAKAISLFAFGLGFLWFFFDPQRQAWHDKIADAIIVEHEER